MTDELKLKSRAVMAAVMELHAPWKVRQDAPWCSARGDRMGNPLSWPCPTARLFLSPQDPSEEPAPAPAANFSPKKQLGIDMPGGVR